MILYNSLESQEKNIAIMIIAFIFMPFLTFLYSLYNYRSIHSQVVIVLFTALFGYNMVAESEGLDLYRMHQMLEIYSPYSIIQITESIINSWTNKGENMFENSLVDLYEPLISIIISRFTNNGKVLMSVFGLIYGFLFIISIRKLIDIQPDNKLYSFLPVLCAAFMIPLGYLAGVRYGTASFIFVFSVIKIIEINGINIRLFFVLISSFFVHFSFALPVVLVLVFVLIRKNPTVLIKYFYAIYLISFFIPDLFSSFFNNSALSFLGDGIVNRSAVYTNKENNLEERVNYFANSSWYIVYPYQFAFWSVKIGVFLKLFWEKKIKHDLKSNQLVLFLLILLIIINFSGAISNFGSRLMLVCGFLFFYYILYLYKLNTGSKFMQNLIIVLAALMALKIILEIRFIIEYTSLILFYGTVFHVFTDGSNVSLWTLINIWYQKIAYYR